NRSRFAGLWIDGNNKTAAICIQIQNNAQATVASGNLDFFDIGIRNCQIGVQIGIPGANQSNNSEVTWWNLNLVNNTTGYFLTSYQAGYQWFYGLLGSNNWDMMTPSNACLNQPNVAGR